MAGIAAAPCPGLCTLPAPALRLLRDVGEPTPPVVYWPRHPEHTAFCRLLFRSDSTSTSRSTKALRRARGGCGGGPRGGRGLPRLRAARRVFSASGVRYAAARAPACRLELPGEKPLTELSGQALGRLRREAGHRNPRARPAPRVVRSPGFCGDCSRGSGGCWACSPERPVTALFKASARSSAAGTCLRVFVVSIQPSAPARPTPTPTCAPGSPTGPSPTTGSSWSCPGSTPVLERAERLRERSCPRCSAGRTRVSRPTASSGWQRPSRRHRAPGALPNPRSARPRRAQEEGTREAARAHSARPGHRLPGKDSRPPRPHPRHHKPAPGPRSARGALLRPALQPFARRTCAEGPGGQGGGTARTRSPTPAGPACGRGTPAALVAWIEFAIHFARPAEAAEAAQRWARARPA